MAKEPTEGGRKLVEFDALTWHALNLLSRESMMSFQELADEAFRDLLHKYGRPTDLKSARCARARRVQFQGGGDSREMSPLPGWPYCRAGFSFEAPSCASSRSAFGQSGH
jgi:hypothetical protein